MAEITITAFNPIWDNAQISPKALTAPAAVDLTKALAVRLDPTTGKFQKAGNNLTLPLDFVGLITKATLADYEGVAFRGLAYIDGLSSVNYGALLFLGTNGAILDTDPGLNEQQTFTITGTPTGGTFTLTFGGQTTGNIAYNATAAVVQAALEALSSIKAGNVIVTGGALPGAAVVVNFVNDLGKQNVGALTFDLTSLTGGTPAATVVETTPGVRSIPVARVMPRWKSGATAQKMVEIF